ncbi:MAG TPA: hypothetical protein VLP30_07275 [Desulfatirhabdiaceae bacterium]|nr:hypothetical protein [Desulfatirhabdiaceae bacterium]
MANIISLNQRLQAVKDQKDILNRKRKAVVVRRAFLCSRCSSRCEKCGMEINPDDFYQTDPNHDHTIPIPYRFCEGCLEEYRDYIKRLQGKGNSQYYWRNDDWLESWRRWMDYQASMDRYVKTKEFVQLLEEIQQSNSQE